VSENGNSLPGRKGRKIFMEMQPKPFVWQMIKEAVEVHGNKTTNIAVRDWILEHYPGTNVNTILNQIIVCTVNHESRVHYKENNRPRRCDDIFDFLYRSEAGKLEMYDPRLHGLWEIAENEKGVLLVKKVNESRENKKDEVSFGSGYLEGHHLRTYLAKNLHLIEEGIQLYVDVFGNDGVEYPSDFGPIDILAIDKQGRFVVIEIKTERFTDVSSGQILKFRNWVRRHLASGNKVRGYLIGSEIPEHIRYSLADCDDIYLKEYNLSIKLKDIPGISDLDTGSESSSEVRSNIRSFAQTA